MSNLRQLAASIFMFGFEGTEPDEPVRRFLAEGLGAVILFGRNANDGEEAARLTGELRAVAGRPLLIAADQEGGSVLRIRRNGTLWPSAMGMGRLETDQIQALGRACGEELRAAGINMNLAPVADVNTRENPGIGTRAFSEDPSVAARAVAAWATGLQSAGVVATVKHFPGLGGARTDTHLARTVIETPRDELMTRDVAPFQMAFRAGARAAMTSHSHYLALDPDNPATTSKHILSDLLRRWLGFDGVLVTDDMRMGAITAHADPAAGCVAALYAGADMLLICRDAAAQEAALDGVVRAVEEGRIPRARLEEAARRVASLTAWAAAQPGPTQPLKRLHERNVEMLEPLLNEIVRVVRNRDDLIPLPWRGESVGLIFPSLQLHTPVEELVTGEAELLAAWQAALGGAGLLRYDPAGVDAAGDEVSAFLERHPRRIVFTAEAHLHPNQAALLARAARGECVQVALRTPHDADLVPGIGTVLASYGYLPNALATVGRMLLGR